MATIVLLAWAAACTGCGAGGWGPGRPDACTVKPTIAVMKFENRAACPMGWNLGDGMRDVLVDRLVSTGRFTVMERPELARVMDELRLQHSGVTRQQRRAALGKLKNVQYLIKGTITDFGHVATRRGMFNGFGWDIFGGGARAVMGMTVYVVEVESGQIICSESLTESVRASNVDVRADYKAVSFGGSTFYRKPLGRATAKVIDKAVRRVGRAVAGRPWEPKVALVREPRTVVINGGRDRRVRVGAEYDVLEVGEPIVDPDTGDVIGTQPGKFIGRLRVTRVHPRYSEAQIVVGEAGDFKVGQHCRTVPAVASG